MLKQLFNILTQTIDEFGLQLQNLSSMASDGAAVMTGACSGVAARLKEVNSHVITFHCLCYKLALACTDTTSDIAYIKNIKLWLKQLWKMLENSPTFVASVLKRFPVSMGKLTRLLSRAFSISSMVSATVSRFNMMTV